jgi:L-amino acid N-acyltransferase YncA
VRIRPAEPRDAGRIAEIYGHYVATSAATFDEEPPEEHDVAVRIASARLPFLVADTGERVDGYAYLAPYHPRSAYRHTAECSVYVADEARGRGIGGALLDALLSEAGDAGIREVIAIIGVTGDPSSVELHRARGFSEVGTLKAVGYKHNRWYDTVLMQRSLLP